SAAPQLITSSREPGSAAASRRSGSARSEMRPPVSEMVHGRVPYTDGAHSPARSAASNGSRPMKRCSEEVFTGTLRGARCPGAIPPGRARAGPPRRTRGPGARDQSIPPARPPGRGEGVRAEGPRSPQGQEGRKRAPAASCPGLLGAAAPAGRPAWAAAPRRPDGKAGTTRDLGPRFGDLGPRTGGAPGGEDAVVTRPPDTSGGGGDPWNARSWPVWTAPRKR